MTREEINYVNDDINTMRLLFNALIGDLCNQCRHNDAEEMEGIRDRLIKRLLEQESCEDAISRQAVIDILKDKWNMFSDANDAMQESIDTIEAIPSVTPEQRTGRWIPTGYDGYADGNPVYDWWECSECGWEHTGDEETLTPFCPNCGARMEVMQNDD